ncbi:unnamed protein product [Chondrus crispus]|uniref:Uncharacterized protein n=1 Tax=Chondrus crispus TaxID=2769 RepID=R7QL33_CHOCR|nr:unnamed protein product [Chondrus crispus]CDF38789.1 unnamed protein product [Chondrus crispus]|eukprot:XP_005718694.1 unnamed protein product [Chondrus crispus]
MDPYEAVGWIRALRRGAINARQLAFLQHYTPRPLHIPNHTRPRSRSRSGALVGALWPTLKGARPFRPRSPQSGKHLNAHPFPLQPSRFSNVLAQSRS